MAYDLTAEEEETMTTQTEITQRTTAALSGSSGAC